MSIDRFTIDYVYYGEHEKVDFASYSIFAEIRRSFFKDKKRYKNRIVKEINGVTYHCAYDIEPGKFMKWKKMCQGRLLERAQENENGYDIISQDDDRKLFKKSSFNNDHIWLKTEYFSELPNKKCVLTLMPSEDNNIILKDSEGNRVEFLPYLNKKSRVIKPMLISDTNIGLVEYYTEYQIDQLESFEKNNCNKESDSMETYNSLDREDQLDSSSHNVNVVEDIEEALNNEDQHHAENQSLAEDVYYSDNDKSLEDIDFNNIYEQLSDINQDEEETINESNLTFDNKSDNSENIKNENQEDYKEFEEIKCFDDDNFSYINIKSGPDDGQEVINESLSNRETKSIDEYPADEYSEEEQLTLFDLKENKQEIIEGAKDKEEIENIEQTQDTASQLSTNNNSSMPYTFEYKCCKDKDCDYINYKPSKMIKENNHTYLYFGETQKGSDQFIARNGYGKTVMEDGKTAFDGYYVDDQRDGFGVYYYNSGNINYVGDWKKNKRHGMGISFSADRSLVNIGSWDSDTQHRMSSTFDNKGNMIFAGKIKEGKRDGVGLKYNLEDSRILVEQWKAGSQLSQGTIFDNTGRLLYYGELNHDKPNGTGVQYKEDGTVRYKGEWFDGKYHGLGCLYLDNGNKIEGSFVNGEVLNS